MNNTNEGIQKCKAAIDAIVGIKSAVLISLSGEEATLFYKSPTGITLFYIFIRNFNGIWRLDSTSSVFPIDQTTICNSTRGDY